MVNLAADFDGSIASHQRNVFLRNDGQGGYDDRILEALGWTSIRRAHRLWSSTSTR